jgi:hypothetical protein
MPGLITGNKYLSMKHRNNMVYTLTEYPMLTNRPLIADLFKTDILLVYGTDLEAVSHENWPRLKSKILDFASKKNIKLIILDGTGDPCILNETHGGYCPSYIDIQKDLDQTFKTIIITEDYTYYYHPTNDIFYLPYNLWLPATRSIHKYYSYQDTVYDTTLNKTKSLMCLNRSLVWHRIYMLMLMHNKPWIENIDFSFVLPMGNRLDNKPVISKYITEKEKQIIKKIPTPIFLDYENSADDVIIMYANGGTSVNTPVYSRCAINLVTETTVNQGIAFTEKTAKAIMAYQIPILVSTLGANQHLEDLGIDMFSDYVPWKEWDNIEDDKLRMNKIVDFVDSIMQNQDSILKTHSSFHQRLIKNKQYFHSDKFINLCLKQVIDLYPHN